MSVSSYSAKGRIRQKAGLNEERSENRRICTGGSPALRIQIYGVRVTVSVHALTSFPLNGASPAELPWLAGTKKSISSA